MVGLVVFLVIVSLSFSAGLLFARARFWRESCGELNSRVDFMEERVKALANTVSKLSDGLGGDDA